MLSGGVVGAFLGYLYYYYIGCNSGTCPITSSALTSSAYGTLIGVVFMWPEKEKQKRSTVDKHA